MKNKDLQIFLKREKIVYLADFFLMYPCNTYLHLAHGLLSGFLNTHKLTFSNPSSRDPAVEVHSIPTKYIPHEDLCRDFNLLVFKLSDINKLKRYRKKFPKFNLTDFREYDFCTPYNIEKIVPQLAYIMWEYSRRQNSDFCSNEAKEIFYSKEDKYHSRWEGERATWNVPMDILWPKYVLRTLNCCKPDSLEEHSKTLVDNIKGSNLADACHPALIKEYARHKEKGQRPLKEKMIAEIELCIIAKIVDTFFPTFKKGGLSAARRANLILNPNDNLSHEAKRKKWQRLKTKYKSVTYEYFNIKNI